MNEMLEKAKELKDLKTYNDVGNWNFSDLEYETEYLDYWDMYEELRRHVDRNSVVLDLGTGGGEKALTSIPDIALLIGTDANEKMIETANENLKKYPEKRAKFVVMDSLKMTFPKNFFDAVVVRHTVMNAKDIYDCLKPGGIVVVEDIDKEDCEDLKKEFGRGQSMDDEAPLRAVDYFLLQEAGFSKIEKHQLFFNEYYKTKEDLMMLLLKTPIIDDYLENRKIDEILDENSEQRKYLENYVQKYSTDKGILLKRRYCAFLAAK